VITVSRWSPSDVRAQTEPLAALIAVTFIAVALAMYGNVITDAMPDTGESDTTGVTMDRVWSGVEHDGKYDPENGDELQDLEPDTFPEGKVVYVHVSRIDDDDAETIYEERVKFDRSGEVMTTGDDIERKDGAKNATRPVPVVVEPGNVVGGKLRVEVWG